MASRRDPDLSAVDRAWDDDPAGAPEQRAGIDPGQPSVVDRAVAADDPQPRRAPTLEIPGSELECEVIAAQSSAPAERAIAPPPIAPEHERRFFDIPLAGPRTPAPGFAMMMPRATPPRPQRAMPRPNHDATTLVRPLPPPGIAAPARAAGSEPRIPRAASRQRWVIGGGVVSIALIALILVARSRPDEPSRATSPPPRPAIAAPSPATGAGRPAAAKLALRPAAPVAKPRAKSTASTKPAPSASRALVVRGSAGRASGATATPSNRVTGGAAKPGAPPRKPPRVARAPGKPVANPAEHVATKATTKRSRGAVQAAASPRAKASSKIATKPVMASTARSAAVAAPALAPVKPKSKPPTRPAAKPAIKRAVARPATAS